MLDCPWRPKHMKFDLIKHLKVKYTRQKNKKKETKRNVLKSYNL